MHLLDQGSRTRLTKLATLVRRLATDFTFDSAECGDPFDGLASDLGQHCLGRLFGSQLAVATAILCPLRCVSAAGLVNTIAGSLAPACLAPRRPLQSAPTLADLPPQWTADIASPWDAESALPLRHPGWNFPPCSLRFRFSCRIPRNSDTAGTTAAGRSARPILTSRPRLDNEPKVC